MIKEWPQSDRPREKCLKDGAAALSNAELLAIFFRTGIRGKSAVTLAQEALHEWGGLRQLLESDLNHFTKKAGLTSNKYIALKAAVELSKRYLLENLKEKTTLKNPNETKAYLCAALRDKPYEIFACLFLDGNHRIIAFEELFRGTLDAAEVYPREVIRRIISHNAAAVIFAHNHPRGFAKPSLADKTLTQHLSAALKMIHVSVLDHIIVGESSCYSFCEQGDAI